MTDQPVKFLQISDMHILDDPAGELLGVNTNESLQATLQLVEAEKNHLDFIILSGDISQDGSHTSYKRVAKLFKPFNVPVYCVPGNHDDAKVMDQVYPLETISNHKHIILKNWQIILLDSHIPEAVEGLLDAKQLKFMEACLQSYPEHHAIILFHHHPLSVGSGWLDQIGLTNANIFWKTISNYPKVSAVLFGHIHQVIEKKVEHVQCYSTPSTCIQFNRQQEKFGLEKLPPGLRVIELFANGHLKTEVKRLAHYVGTFDEGAKGY